jgi:two-component system, oxyanion-binding sensor
MTDTVTAAFVPLVDCAVLVAAREAGFAQTHGIELELVKKRSWASIRDHLNLGYVDCAHALAPMPIASALGIGQVRGTAVVPLVLGRGGNAVTLSRELAAEVRAAAGERYALGPLERAEALASVVRQRRRSLTLAMVYPFSGHNFELRYWLATGGIDPDRDVRLVGIPPPLMVESLKARHVDGFCVGEPWNSLAVDRGLGEIVATKSQIVPGGVEKVLAVRRSMVADDLRLSALLRALVAAAEWVDAAENRETLAAMLARPEYLDVAPELIERVLAGRVVVAEPELDADAFLYFSRDRAGRPDRGQSLWLYAQMVRWGQAAHSADAQRAATEVFVPEIYDRLFGSGAPADGGLPVSPFDGIEIIDGDVDAYLERFEIRTRSVPAADGLEA